MRRLGVALSALAVLVPGAAGGARSWREDAVGDLYAVSLDGQIYKLTP
jgi:hypothetical protein